jgi:hypothetical protein
LVDKIIKVIRYIIMFQQQKNKQEEDQDRLASAAQSWCEEG